MTPEARVNLPVFASQKARFDAIAAQLLAERGGKWTIPATFEQLLLAWESKAAAPAKPKRGRR